MTVDKSHYSQYLIHLFGLCLLFGLLPFISVLEHVDEVGLFCSVVSEKQNVLIPPSLKLVNKDSVSVNRGFQ